MLAFITFFDLISFEEWRFLVLKRDFPCQKTFIFQHCFHNYSLNEAGKAGLVDILNGNRLVTAHTFTPGHMPPVIYPRALNPICNIPPKTLLPVIYTTVTGSYPWTFTRFSWVKVRVTIRVRIGVPGGYVTGCR